MSWAAIGVAAVGATVSLVKSQKQKKAAKKIKIGDKKVSERMYRVEKDATTRATSSKFAGQSRVEERIGQTSADILEKAKEAASPNEYLDIVAKQGGALQDKQLKIGQIALADKQRREEGASAASLNVGAEETRILEENIAEQKAAKLALLSASDKNKDSAMSDASGIAATLATNKSASEGSPVVNDTPPGQKTGTTRIKTLSELEKLEKEEEEIKRQKRIN